MHRRIRAELVLNALARGPLGAEEVARRLALLGVQGVRNHADRCPIALALNRLVGGRWRVGCVRATLMRRGQGYGAYSIPLPTACAAFVRRFDGDSDGPEGTAWPALSYTGPAQIGGDL